LTNNEIPEDFLDIVSCLLANNCEFVVVGAYALAFNGVQRATADIDFLVNPNPENAKKVFDALVLFGAPLASHGVTQTDFEIEGNVYQIGLPPNRIDLLTSIEGVTFKQASETSKEANLGEHLVKYISADTQIINKKATGRTKDLADAEALENILKNSDHQ